MKLKTASAHSFNEAAASTSGVSRANVKMIVAIAMIVWLAVVFFLGARGAFVGQPGSPPLPILLSVTLPLIVFFSTYVGSNSFRSFILSADLRFGAALQAWRVGGMEFLVLYLHGILPGIFALPAGIGDIAIGLTAPLIVSALIRDRAFAASRRYVIWNILGIIDLVVAVGTGALSSGFFGGVAGSVATTPMSQLPLLLIPAYFVPFFLMLHFTALVQARQLVRARQLESRR